MTIRATTGFIHRLTVLLGLLLVFGASGAASPEDFTAEHFQALQERGEPILVDIAADCSGWRRNSGAPRRRC
jgi:hypothetical protein